MKLFVIGAGGAGSWLIPQLVMLKIAPVVVVDKDVLELSNMNRQLFTLDDIGKTKADALKERWGFSQVIPEWYRVSLIDHQPEDIIFGCVDNHAGRRAILNACDTYKCRAIIMGNGTINADAYFYTPEWAGTKADPRIRYPEIETTEDGPLRAPGCTGPVIEDTTPQTVIANTSAVTLALQLFWIWVMRSDEIASCKPSVPVEYALNDFAIKQTKLKELL